MVTPARPLPLAAPEPAAYWTPAGFAAPDGDRVRCTLCPHDCRLVPGQVGRCHVRRATRGGMETATRATSVAHFDAVERKPLYHYRPGLTLLTLAPPGCSFACGYCLNYRLSQYGRSAGVGWTAGPVDPAGVVAAAAARGAGVALSYSEPTLAAELTLALSAAARPRGVDVVWKTNGFITPTALAELAPHLAAVNVDLKAPDDRRHRRLTGAPLAPVLDALAGFAREGVWVEVGTPLVPGFNAEPADVRRTADLILAALGPDAPWHLIRFVPEYRMRGPAPTPPDVLAAAADAARAAGVRFVYVERALGDAGRTTWCPGCGSAVVEREPWAVRSVGLRGGACPRCGGRVPGRWDEEAV